MRQAKQRQPRPPKELREHWTVKEVCNHLRKDRHWLRENYAEFELFRFGKTITITKKSVLAFEEKCKVYSGHL